MESGEWRLGVANEPSSIGIGITIGISKYVLYVCMYVRPQYNVLTSCMYVIYSHPVQALRTVRSTRGSARARQKGPHQRERVLDRQIADCTILKEAH